MLESATKESYRNTIGIIGRLLSVHGCTPLADTGVTLGHIRRLLLWVRSAGLGIGVCIEESICDTTGIISRLLWIPKGITWADSTQVARSHRNARSGLGLLYVDTGKGVCIVGVSTSGT